MFTSALRFGLVPRGLKYAALKDSASFKFFRVVRHTHILQPVGIVLGTYLMWWEINPRFKPRGGGSDRTSQNWKLHQ